MKKILFVFFILTTIKLNSQVLPISSVRYLEESLTKVNGKEVALLESKNMDFSRVWMEKQNAVIGFIGIEYQKIQIRFISVIKNKYTENEYFVYGKSMVNDNICNFQGKLIITHVKLIDNCERNALYKEALKQGDKEAANRFEKTQGVVLAEYFLLENPQQKGSGEFIGVVKSYFYIKDKDVFFDDIDLSLSDNYCNNQFVGIWKSYRGIEKICNWGTYRIPNSGDLDIGVGEFFPNKKYFDKGWSIYFKAKSENENVKEKDFEWWKEH